MDRTGPGVSGVRGPVVACESYESLRRRPGVSGDEAVLGRDMDEYDAVRVDSG